MESVSSFCQFLCKLSASTAGKMELRSSKTSVSPVLRDLDRQATVSHAVMMSSQLPSSPGCASR